MMTNSFVLPGGVAAKSVWLKRRWMFFFCPQLLLSVLHASGVADESQAGLTISFSGQIPVFSGNGIPFRNFGKFRRISLNFGRNLLNFEFENEIYRKIPKF